MICNYENITDYCSNRYSYFFNDVIASGTIVAVDDSEFAPVLRVDNITGQTKLLTQYSTDTIPTCNSTDDSEGTNDWECYTIFRYIAQGSIGDPPFGVFQEAQKQIIKEAYNTSLQDGVYVTINSQTVLLGANISDQIAYKSILSYAQALYDDDTDATMPSFTDVNGTIYNLNYTDLVEVFKTYLTKLIYYKNLQDTLLNEVDTCNSLSDLQQLNWCGTKPLAGELVATKYSSVSLASQQSAVSCDDINELCDPPCDPNSCLVCVDGSCESSCGENQYCCDGVCQDEPCCESDEDCAAGELCCNSSCQEAVEQCLTGCIEITVNEYMSDSCPDGMNPINDPAPAPPVLTKCSGAGGDCINNPTSPFIGNYGVLVTHSCFDEQLPCDECPATCCLVCPSNNT